MLVCTLLTIGCITQASARHPFPKQVMIMAIIVQSWLESFQVHTQCMKSWEEMLQLAPRC